jgi:hypothetical protein
VYLQKIWHERKDRIFSRGSNKRTLHTKKFIISLVEEKEFKLNIKLSEKLKWYNLSSTLTLTNFLKFLAKTHSLHTLPESKIIHYTKWSYHIQKILNLNSSAFDLWANSIQLEGQFNYLSIFVLDKRRRRRKDFFALGTKRANLTQLEGQFNTTWGPIQLPPYFRFGQTEEKNRTFFYACFYAVFYAFFYAKLYTFFYSIYAVYSIWGQINIQL